MGLTSIRMAAIDQAHISRERRGWSAKPPVRLRPDLAGSGQAAFGRHGQIAGICTEAAEGRVAKRFI